MKKFIFFVLAICISCRQSSFVTVIDDGRSDYRIVVNQQADSLEMKAAEILQHYFKRISHCTLPASRLARPAGNSIYVGTFASVRNYQDTDNQISIYIRNNNLYVLGIDPQSVIYAEYILLERFAGCRYYTPGVEKIPASSSLAFREDLNYSYKPAISTRTIHSRLFYEHPEFADKHKVSPQAFPGYVPAAHVHTFHVFMPSEVLYDRHPEYYALRNGHRLPTQLCLTNPDVFRIVRDSISSLLNRYPGADVVSVSQDDNTQYCECANCTAINDKATSPSGSVIAFVNKIAAEFPEKMISTLAYQYSRKAPVGIRPAGNVLITLCSIEWDRSGPIAEKCTDFADDLTA